MDCISLHTSYGPKHIHQRNIAMIIDCEEPYRVHGYCNRVHNPVRLFICVRARVLAPAYQQAHACACHIVAHAPSNKAVHDASHHPKMTINRILPQVSVDRSVRSTRHRQQIGILYVEL
jgi:hypothetical protein